MRAILDGTLSSQFVRYVVSGLAATAVHFCVLTFNLNVIGMRSAGLANGIAAVFGIAASFVGSRYFVFSGSTRRVMSQGLLFLLAYACIALLHALVLYAWTDRMGLDYRIGFIVATCMQMTLSFFINKFVIFK